MGAYGEMNSVTEDARKTYRRVEVARAWWLEEA